MAETTTKYVPIGEIMAGDYRDIEYVGKTRYGDAVTIKLPKAINLGNIDLTFKDKDDVVPSVTFTATYSNVNNQPISTDEPWSIEILGSGVPNGVSSIMLDVGVLKIGNQVVGLSRGGGSFNVARIFRRIAADGDRGPVQERIVMTDSEATLTLNVLTFLDADVFTKLWPAIAMQQM